MSDWYIGFFKKSYIKRAISDFDRKETICALVEKYDLKCNWGFNTLIIKCDKCNACWSHQHLWR